jgi:hypothetical protein
MHIGRKNYMLQRLKKIIQKNYSSVIQIINLHIHSKNLAIFSGFSPVENKYISIIDIS